MIRTDNLALIMALLLLGMPSGSVAAGIESVVAPPLGVKPSDHQGRLGQYTGSTPDKQCKYHVYVPASYSASNPAGLHLYLDGQGSCANNQHFGRWSRHFLEPHNLIGINMQYLDGNNANDPAGKLAAARFAVAQVQADYKIIPGRGVISSFSGGGVIHGRFWKAFVGKETPDREWPFLHHALYSSNWFAGIKGGAPMSWFLAAGDRTKDNVWMTMMGVMHHLQQQGTRACAIRITKDKGHAATGEDAAASAEVFARTDLVFAPFLYELDWTEPRLPAIAKDANARRFQAALSGLSELEQHKTLTDARRQDIVELRRLIETRIAAVVSLAETLLKTDAVLAETYLPVILGQLQDLPEQQVLKKRFEPVAASETYRKTLDLHRAFVARFPRLMNGKNGKPVPDQIAFLASCAETAGEHSVLGQTARDFLAFKETTTPE